MRWAGSLFALWLLGGIPAHADAPPPVPSTAPFQWREVSNTAFALGEELRYVIKWGVVTAGRASFAIPDYSEINGRPVIHVVSEARSAAMLDAFYKVRDRNEVWLDQAAMCTARYLGRIREGSYHVDRHLEVDQAAGRYRYESKRLDKDDYKVIEGTAPAHVLDAFGSLFYVRTQPLVTGQDIIIDVLDGKKVYPMVVKVHERETIKVPAGKFDCFRVEPQLRDPGIFIRKGKKLEVWITADERRLPVRMRSEVFIGHVSAELTDFHHVPPAPR